MNTETNQFPLERVSGFSGQANTKVPVSASNHHLRAVLDAGGLLISIDREGLESLASHDGQTDGLSNHCPCSHPPLRVSVILLHDHSQGTHMLVPDFSLSPRVIYEVFGTHSGNWVHDTPFPHFLSLITSLCLPLVKTSCFSGTISITLLL